MKTALVTGSAGLIGRHFTKYLFDGGWQVTPIDIRSPNVQSRYDARDFFVDLNTPSYDLVIHCAAHVGGRLDIENRAAYIGAYNVQLDGAMFEWALRTRPAHIVYWSSSAAYPISLQNEPMAVGLLESDIDVSWPEPADFTYGWVKLVGERLAQEVAAEGLRVHVFRPFSGWADDQDTSYPVGAFIDRAKRRADPFDVWGDGEQVRDFIHVSDVIAATMAAIDQDYLGPLNLCTGVPTSFNELARWVTLAVGYRPVIQHHLDKPQGVRYRVGDPTELHKVWVPRVSLEEGLRLALEGTA